MRSDKWQWFNSYGDNFLITVEREDNAIHKITVDNLGTVDEYTGAQCLDELRDGHREVYEEVIDMLGTDPSWLDREPLQT